MKFLLFFLSSVAMATTPQTFRSDTSSTNLAATFTAGPQVTLPTAIYSVDVTNGSSSEIEVNCSSSSKPASLSSNSFFVPATAAYSSPLNTLLPSPFLKSCWVRSVSGTISSGVVQIVAWGY